MLGTAPHGQSILQMWGYELLKCRAILIVRLRSNSPNSIMNLVGPASRIVQAQWPNDTIVSVKSCGEYGCGILDGIHGKQPQKKVLDTLSRLCVILNLPNSVTQK